MNDQPEPQPLTDPELRGQLEAATRALGKSETELAALRQVARGYCPDCGRGDAAPTVADWEAQRQRADAAEAERDELRDEIATAMPKLADMTRDRDRQKWYVAENERKTRIQRKRAEQAETTAARVRAECDRIEAAVRANPTNADFDGAYLAAIRHIREALG